MPWTATDAKSHTSLANTAKKQRQWADIANSQRASCMKGGGSEKDCDAKAIRVANGMIKKGTSSEAVDWLMSLINSADVKEQQLAFDYLASVVEEGTGAISKVFETVDLGGGVKLEILEATSHLAFIQEETVFLTDKEQIEVTIEGKTPPAGGKKAVFRALQGRNESKKISGISKNKTFYPGDVAESLAPMLMERPKMYLNHKPLQPLGRPLEDLVAITEKSWADSGSSYVQSDFETGNPATGWVWNIVEKYPSEVGVSIHAAVLGRKAKIDNVEVFAVDKFQKLFSLDVVGEASAGGDFQGITNEGAGDSMDLQILEALKERLEKSKNRSAFWNVAYLLTDMIWSVALERNGTDADKQKKIDGLMKEFEEEMKKLDPVKLFGPGSSDMTHESVVEQFRQLLHQAIGTKDGEAVKPQEGSIVDPEAIKSLTWEQLVAANNAAALAVKKELEEAKKTVEMVNEKLTASETASKKTIEESQKALDVAQKKIDEYQLKEAETQRANKADELLASSKVLDRQNKTHVSEIFRQDLIMLLAQTDGEAKAKARITEREQLIESVRAPGIVRGTGVHPTVLPEAGGNGHPTFVDTTIIESKTADELAANLKAAR